MNTVVECSESCMHLTGYKTGECSGAFDKTISNVNFFTSSSDKPIFYIDLKCEYSLTIENSVLLANNRNDKVYIVSKSNDCKFIQFIFINCLLNHRVTVDGAIYQADNRFEYYDTKHVMVLPHYTHNGCDGPKDIAKNTDAYGCNAGNCVDLICNRTIGFPDGVVTYTTIIHTDLQTATFTPSKSFTFSDKFSESNKFSRSFAFSDSDHFTSSGAFSKTNYFTHSSAFTFTGRFSKSSLFSDSIEFSKSDEFLPTIDFDHTHSFPPSKTFSASNDFSKSKEFTKTNDFTKSDEFSNTKEFSQSSKFSFSKIFTKSKSFTFSNEFTSVAIIPKDSEKGGKLGTGAIAGIAVGAVAALAIIAAVIFFIVKRKRNMIIEEDVETLDGSQPTTNTDNPIYNKNAEDDPFNDDFRD